MNSMFIIYTQMFQTKSYIYTHQCSYLIYVTHLKSIIGITKFPFSFCICCDSFCKA